MGKHPDDHEGNVVYCESFVHWRTKKRVYRKNGGMFRFVFPRKK